MDDLQKVMKQLIENTELYTHLKQNSRRMIEERYEQSVVWEALLREYNSHIFYLNKQNTDYS